MTKLENEYEELISSERVERTQVRPVCTHKCAASCFDYEIKMLIDLKSHFWSTVSVLSDGDAVVLSKVLKLCHCLHTRWSLAPSF